MSRAIANQFWMLDTPAPLERLAAAIPADDLQVCLVWNRAEEEKLKAEGWKEVESE